MSSTIALDTLRRNLAAAEQAFRTVPSSDAKQKLRWARLKLEAAEAVAFTEWSRKTMPLGGLFPRGRALPSV